MKRIHACKGIKRQLELVCDIHSDPFECADRLIIYMPQFDEYGILIHDGGHSYSIIHYCPWCGKKLPNSKRERWFKALKARGYDNPFTQKIPAEFLTDEWYRNRKKAKTSFRKNGGRE